MSSEQCAICGHDGAPERLFIPHGEGRTADGRDDGAAAEGEGGPAGYWVAICRRCGHGEREAARTFEENIGYQEDFYRVEPPAPRVRRWPGRPALLARRVQGMLGSSGRVLDIGCGPGTWLAHFDGRWKKYGVDVSQKAAAVARRETGAEVFCGPVEAYDDAPRDLDLITAFALVEHLQDPTRLVAWCSGHLRPGGLLVLMTGDRESGQARELGPRWPMYQPEEHVHFFSARSLRYMVEAQHMAVVHEEWRPMVYASAHGEEVPRARRMARRLALGTERYVAKAKEIAGFLGGGYYDHLYVYARRLG